MFFFLISRIVLPFSFLQTTNGEHQHQGWDQGDANKLGQLFPGARNEQNFKMKYKSFIQFQKIKKLQRKDGKAAALNKTETTRILLHFVLWVRWIAGKEDELLRKSWRGRDDRIFRRKLWEMQFNFYDCFWIWFWEIVLTSLRLCQLTAWRESFHITHMYRCVRKRFW